LPYNVLMQYDRFQKEAIGHIDNGYSVLVSAPTGAGKTAIAEYIIEKSIPQNQSIIYTAPIKALSNQKFRDFEKQFHDNVGILTGDVSINPHAPLLIMTTEIFRNKTIEEADSLKKYSWAIFDEIHYIDNYERGTVWEESLIFLPAHLKLLCLSATIPNISEFAAWLAKLHKTEIKIVCEEKRPVPLHFFFQFQNEIFDNINNIKFSPRQFRDYRHRRIYQKYKPAAHYNRLSTLIKHIAGENNLPLIYFVFARRKAEYLAEEISSYNFLDAEETEKITELFNELCSKLNLENEPSAKKIMPLVKRGVAYHHAGMLPTLKEAIEQLFTSRLIKVIFTTETFALGINMPARSVVFDAIKKFYGTFTTYLKTRDFFQMAGRAGRRGKDREGFVYLRLHPYDADPKEIRRIIYGRPENIKSQLNNSYATILNLYEKYGERITEVYSLSLHCFQSNRHSQKQAENLIKSKVSLLKDLGFIKNNLLSEKGHFAKAVYGYELILSELYETRFLENLDEEGLAILATAIVFEPRKNQEIIFLPKKAEEIKKRCKKITGDIKYREAKYKIRPFSKRPYFHLASSAEEWIKGSDFNKISALTDTDEGELIRYFRMGLQILKEINSSPASSYLLKERIQKTIKIINRDIIDAEKQLRG